MPRDVTVTFDDQSSHIYQGVPDTATPEQVTQRATSDFPGKQVVHLDGGKGAAAPTAPAAPSADDGPTLLQKLIRVPLPTIAMGATEGIANLASGAVAGPVSDIAKLTAAGYNAATGTKPPVGAGPNAFKDFVQQALTYQPRSDAGKAVAQYNPLALIGRLFSSLGESTTNAILPEEGQPLTPKRAALAEGVGKLVSSAPGLLGVKGAPEGAVKAADLMKGRPGGGAGLFTARGLMQSALKPDLEARATGAAGKAIDTLLNRGVNVSRGGADSMWSRVSELNKQVTDLIEKSKARVSSKTVAKSIDQTSDIYKRFIRQVNSSSDVAALQRAHDDFMASVDRVSADIGEAGRSTLPVQEVQKMKQGTYRQLEKKRAYTKDVNPSDIEAQMELARAMKDAVAKAVPKVDHLNTEESELLNALSITERRLLVAANRNPVGLGMLISTPVEFAAYMADRSEMFKSLVGRMIWRGAHTLENSGTAVKAAGVGAATDQQQPQEAAQ